MILTFTKKRKELENGTKTTTIRIETPTRKDHYLKWAAGDSGGELAHLWWLNPRNQSPECYKIGKPPLKSIRIKTGRGLTNADALKDGFSGIKSLRDCLMDISDIHTDSEFDRAVFYIYEWEAD